MILFLILQTSTFDVKIPVMTAIFLYKSQMRNHRILTRVFLHHVEKMKEAARYITNIRSGHGRFVMKFMTRI